MEEIEIKSQIENTENIENIENIYKITKGFCLIINIINFDGNEKIRRDGSEEDVKLIREAFECHGFEVEDYYDLNDDQIINSIKELVNNEKYKFFDAFVLYIYTHGIADKILCKNSEYIHHQQIIELFSDENCLNLTNKPKLLFFDCGRSYEDEIDSSPLKSFDNTKTQYSDLILCFSTLKGCYSIRNCFAKCLYENLLHQTKEKDIHEILFEVNKSIKQILPVEFKMQFSQAIEYREINLTKLKYYFTENKEQEITKIIEHMKQIKIELMEFTKDKKIPEFQTLDVAEVNKSLDNFLVAHQQAIEFNIMAQNQEKLYYSQGDIIEKTDLQMEQNDDENKMTFYSKNDIKENEFKYLHSKEIKIKNEEIEIIEENVLDKIITDKIVIENCPKLIQIHWNAFGKQTDKITHFYANKKLTNLKSIQNSDYDLFKLINSLVNCEEIWMTSFDYTLQQICLKKLKKLTITGLFSSIKIQSICEFAFYECDQIELIDLSKNDLSFISENVFHFRNENEEKLTINLFNNHLSSFALNSLSNFKRPVKLELQWNEIKYLDEQVFKPFFDANKWNEIEIDLFDINSEGNYWNQCNKNYKSRIIFIKKEENTLSQSRNVKECLFSDKKNIEIKGKPLKQLIIGGVESKIEKISKEIAEEINYFLEKNVKTCFNNLTITNSEIETFVFKSDIFKNIIFKEIIITNSAKKLNHIKFDTDTNIAKKVKHLEITNDLPKNESPQLLNILLNSFENIEEIHMTSPSNLIGKLNLTKLAYLFINGSNSNVKLKSIDDLVFAKCTNLIYIDLSNNDLSKITNDMFKFETESKRKLTVDLSKNKLNETSFAKSSLIINRPVELLLNQNLIKYLDENIFKRFLAQYIENEIYLYDNLMFEYENTKNFWLFYGNFLDEQIYGIKNMIKCLDNVYYDESVKEIIISGTENVDLRTVFNSAQLTNLELKNLNINNQSISSIEDNSFGKFIFEIISIENCKNLARIHKNAFGENSHKIKKIYIWKGISNLVSEPFSDYNLIKFINSLINCEEIMISSFGETIYSIKLSCLKKITFDGQFSNLKIKTIHNDTFYDCDTIELINLNWNHIKIINEFAFRFKNRSEKMLNIDLCNNLLDESSFDLNPLIYFQRPVKLWLNGNNIHYFKKKIFKKFTQNSDNQIVIENNVLNFKQIENLFDVTLLKM